MSASDAGQPSLPFSFSCLGLSGINRVCPRNEWDIGGVCNSVSGFSFGSYMQTLEPIGKQYAVPQIPDAHESEFEVQANLYSALKTKGVDVRGEVAWFDPGTRTHCRFDLVIYENKAPVHILEVKARQVKHKTCLEDTRQGRRYRLFGIPVTFIYGSADASLFVNSWG